MPGALIGPANTYLPELIVTLWLNRVIRIKFYQLIKMLRTHPFLMVLVHFTITCAVVCAHFTGGRNTNGGRAHLFPAVFGDVKSLKSATVESFFILRK